MEWKSPFIVYRVSEDGSISEVFYANNLKDAKYWLTYIAKPGDVLCKTPAHPRHNGDRPEYWSHKQQSGTPCSDQEGWGKFAEERKFSMEFPNEQWGEAE